MNKCPRTPLLFCAALLAATAAQAGEIEGTVDFLASPVSLSITGSQPVATYTVTLTNKSASNTIGNARFVATTTVVGGAAGAQAVFKSASGATCSVSPEGTRVDCSVSTLAVNESKSFTLTFYSPTSGTSIDLAWDAVFDLGTPPGGSNGNFGTKSIALEAIKSDEVKSAVPASDDTLTVFTGNLAVPSDADQFAVQVTVPPVAFNTTAKVIETSDITTADTTCKAQGNFRNCYRSDISVTDVVYTVDSGKFLTFVLRVDKSNLRGGAKIDRVVIRYSVNSEVVESQVNFCLRTHDDRAIPDADGTPCIDSANDYRSRKSSQGWYGFEWTLISLKNGSFDLF